MKITGTIEISGIERVVFYQKNCFVRIHHNGNTAYWYDMKRDRRMSNDTMLKIVREKIANPNRKVWIHGPTINIARKKGKGKGGCKPKKYIVTCEQACEYLDSITSTL